MHNSKNWKNFAGESAEQAARGVIRSCLFYGYFWDFISFHGYECIENIGLIRAREIYEDEINRSGNL